MKITRTKRSDVFFLNPPVPVRFLRRLAALLAAVLVALWAPSVKATGSAFDDGCNDAGSSGATGGTGFSAWVVNVGSGGGTYTATDATLAGNGCSTVWGIYTGGSAVLTESKRTFASSGTLSVGQQITADMHNGGINSGGSEGLSLYNSSGNSVFELYYANGESGWHIHDSSSSGAGYVSTIPYAGSGCRAIFTLTSATTYSLTVQVPTNGTVYGPFTGTLLSPSGGGSITTLRFYTYNIGGGNNLQFNNIAVSCPSFTAGTPSGTTVCANNTATFTTTATGASSPTYQWQISVNGGTSWSNVSVGSGGTSASYSTNAVSAANGNKFRCVVTDACGTSSTSAAATLTVDTTTFTTSQGNVTCNGGNNGSITVTASGGSGTYTYSKDNGATYAANGGSFTSLAAGTYNIAVKDSNNCLSTTNAVTITQPGAVVVTEATGSHVNVTCNGNSTGVIVMNTATGGSGSGYQYSKDNGSTWQAGTTFSGLAAATYQMKAEDGNGCVSAAVPVTITQPSAVAVTEATGSHVNVTCNGNSTGVIVMNTATGGSGSGYQYSKDGGSTWQAGTTFSGLAAATYQMAAKDGNGCVSGNVGVTITQPGAVTVTEATGSHVNDTCNGGNNGVIVLNPATGGSGSGYQYSKDGGSTWQAGTTFSGLTAATYQMAAKDGNSCVSANVAVTITQPSAVTFTTSSNNNTVCGAAGGSITVSASGGSGTYTYSDDNGATFQGGNTFSSLAAGAYLIVVKDSNGCTTSPSSVAISDPNGPSLGLGETDVTCTNGNNGTITATFSGSGPFQIKIDAGSYSTQTSPYTFTGLAAGSHTVVVQDSSGCTTSSTTGVSQPAAVTFTYGTTNITCNGGSDGSIVVTNAGGSGTGYSVSLDNGVTFTATNLFTGLAAGTYDLVVKDGNGCLSATNAIALAQPAAVTFTVTTNEVSCSGNSNGSLVINASGGSGTYTYSDNGGTSYQPGNTFSSLTAGSYTVVVKDSNGCTSSGSAITVTQPATVTFTVATNEVSCNGGNNGSITVSASGGNGTYTYSDNGGTSYQSGSTFSSLTAGSYTVVVKDSNGCTSSGSAITVTQPSALSSPVTPSSATICTNTTQTFTANGSGGTAGYTYAWTGPSGYTATGASITVGTAGTYNVTATDANGCTASGSATLTVSPAPVGGTATAGTTSFCSSGSTVITLTGSVGTIQWQASPDNVTFTNIPGATGTTYTTPTLTATTYYQAVLTNNACSAALSSVATVNITAPAAISTQPSATTTCNGSGASFTVVADGSPTYAWRKRGSGWGSANGWTVSGTGSAGAFIGDSSMNGGSGTGAANSSSNINSSANSAFGLFANSGGVIDAFRSFGSLVVGQTIQVDIDNGYIDSGGPSVGFGIQNSAGQNLWEFLFAGGASSYTVNAGSISPAVSIGYTDGGVRIIFTLTSSTTYSATIITKPNTTGPTTFGPYTGTLTTPGSGTQVPAKLHFWNSNAGSGTAHDYFFNNLFVGGVPGTTSVGLYSDDAANYTGLATGNNSGQGPITSVLPGATEFSGANTATLTINPATGSDAANYDVVVYNSCAAARSGAVALTVNPLPTITLGSSPSVAFGSTSANLPYSATANGANKYAIAFDSAAHTAGFSDVALTTLPSTPIVVTVPGGLDPATFNGTLTVQNGTTGCTSTNYAFTVTVTKAGQAITFGALTAVTYNDAPFGLTATANSGLTVGFASDNASVATVSGSTVTIVGAGTAHIIASQAGNTDYNAATSITNTLTVNKAATSVGVGSSANPVHSYGSVYFTATLPADATGTVQFKTNSVAFGGAKTLSGGAATSDATTSLPRGTQTVTAEYAGDSNYLGSTNALSQVMSDSPPVANPVSLTRPSNVSIKLLITDLLTNATDVDGDTLVLTAVGASTNGVTVKTNSTYVLYSNVNNVADSFTYTVNDGHGGAATNTVTVSIVGGQTGQSLSITPGGVVTLNFAGIPGYEYVTLRSTNLTMGPGWIPISTNTAPSTGLFQVSDDFRDLNGGVPVPTSTPPASAYYELMTP